MFILHGEPYLVTVLFLLFAKLTVTYEDMDSDVNRTCHHVTGDGQHEVAVNGANEIRNCSGLCVNNSERFNRSSTLLMLSDQLLSDEEKVNLNNSDIEWDGGIFIPAFQLFNCAVKSLHRLRKLERHLTDRGHVDGLRMVKQSRNFLRKMCESHMYNTCCHKSIETIAIRGYMKVPACLEIVSRLGKNLPKTTGTKENQTYFDFLNAQIHEERLRAKLFVDAYRVKAFL